MTRFPQLILWAVAVGATAGACEQTDAWRSSARPAAGAAGASGSSGGAGSAGAGGKPMTETSYGDLTSASRHDLAVAMSACAVDVFGAAAAAADALADATAKAAAAPDDAALAQAARDRYLAMFDAWAEADVLGFGPSGPGPAAPAPTPGGQDLAPGIYGWPLVSRCEIEKLILSKAYEAPAFAATSLLPTRSLAALDLLMFHDGADQGCGPSHPIAAPYAQLSAPELRGRRAVYSDVVARDVRTRARALSDLWAPSSGNFAAALAGAGQGSAVYATDQLALNAISDAMFFVDTRVKDRKLGQPLGLIDCAKPSCPEAVESPWARRSREAIRRNLLGFRRMATGCGLGGAGIGFDDVLHGIGQTAAAEQLRALVAGALAAIDAVDQPHLGDALASQPAQVAAARAAVKALTDFLKSDFLTLLDLELPKSLEGDND